MSLDRDKDKDKDKPLQKPEPIRPPIQVIDENAQPAIYSKRVIIQETGGKKQTGTKSK